MELVKEVCQLVWRIDWGFGNMLGGFVNDGLGNVWRLIGGWNLVNGHNLVVCLDNKLYHKLCLKNTLWPKLGLILLLMKLLSSINRTNLL